MQEGQEVLLQICVPRATVTIGQLQLSNHALTAVLVIVQTWLAHTFCWNMCTADKRKWINFYFDHPPYVPPASCSTRPALLSVCQHPPPAALAAVSFVPPVRMADCFDTTVATVAHLPRPAAMWPTWLCCGCVRGWWSPPRCLHC